MKTLYKQHKTLPEEYIIKKVIEFLKEDCSNQDITGQATMHQNNNIITSHIIAEEDLILSGTPIITHMFSNDKIESHKVDGEHCCAGDIITTISGTANSILSKERVALNLIQRLTGISTLTHQYVSTLNSTKIKILDTRKTTPGLRLFEKYAVTIGGGYNHRLDLLDGVMFKDNHLTLLNNLSDAIQHIKKCHPNKKIQIEVDNFNQLKVLLHIHKKNIDAILLDNMSPQETTQCTTLIRKQLPQCFVESSGGITLKNLLDYKNLDIDGISIGALTHQAQSKNIKMEFVVL
tara:strand:- start:25 stop:897 length:873 start_codon:yes stop_codon:yes gene_type:complete